MRKLFSLLFLTIVIGSTALADSMQGIYQDKDTKGGKIEDGAKGGKVSGSAILLNTNGQLFTVQPGPVQILYKRPSFKQVFNGKRNIYIMQGDNIAEFDSRKSFFRSYGDFKTYPQEATGVVLLGSHEDHPIRTYETEGTITCRDSFLCTCGGFDYGPYYSPPPNYNPGPYGHHCGSYYYDCSGLQRVRIQSTEFSVVDFISFINTKTQENLGTIVGEPYMRTDQVIVKRLSSCM